ncbi:PREDICTED: uncharacterized protein LOC106811466 [Priapulus caudatus]|uniref:Uncharacterized protein LOC106811466 n=1 Tax=Priapulus caudatus TaxID=37621 RepID=A0ABM1EEF6_PRICU|nr:PREDICTED: uncharacterized protein LOC106811466 [Priapulus caudatus]
MMRYTFLLLTLSMYYVQPLFLDATDERLHLYDSKQDLRNEVLRPNIPVVGNSDPRRSEDEYYDNEETDDKYDAKPTRYSKFRSLKTDRPDSQETERAGDYRPDSYLDYAVMPSNDLGLQLVLSVITTNDNNSGERYRRPFLFSPSELLTAQGPSLSRQFSDDVGHMPVFDPRMIRDVFPFSSRRDNAFRREWSQPRIFPDRPSIVDIPADPYQLMTSEEFLPQVLGAPMRQPLEGYEGEQLLARDVHDIFPFASRRGNAYRRDWALSRSHPDREMALGAAPVAPYPVMAYEDILPEALAPPAQQYQGEQVLRTEVPAILPFPPSGYSDAIDVPHRDSDDNTQRPGASLRTHQFPRYDVFAPDSLREQFQLRGMQQQRYRTARDRYPFLGERGNAYRPTRDHDEPEPEQEEQNLSEEEASYGQDMASAYAQANAEQQQLRIPDREDMHRRFPFLSRRGNAYRRDWALNGEQREHEPKRGPAPENRLADHQTLPQADRV